MSETSEIPQTLPTAATPLIVIENCIADQLVGSSVVPLATGTLQLLSRGPAPPPELVGSESTFIESASSSETKSIGTLTLQVGQAAFVLEPHLTTVFTHSENARWYFWTLTLPSSEPTSVDHPSGHSTVGSGSYIRLTLPEGVEVPGSALEKSRDAFEDVLIGRGFLSGDGTLDVVSEIGKSVKSGAGAVTEELRLRTQEYVYM